MQKPQSCEIATGDDLFGIFKQVGRQWLDDSYESLQLSVPSGVMIYTFTLLLFMRKTV